VDEEITKPLWRQGLDWIRIVRRIKE
jgi:hypothetical protein